MTRQTISPPPGFELQSPSRRGAARTIAGCVGLAALGLAACRREPDRPWQGSVFPAFSLPAPDGTMHDSREYAGQPLLINFWATWCPPCREEMADLNALHRELAPKGLQVLAISVDADRNLVREYLRRETLDFTILVDSGQQWCLPALQVPGFPTTYLVGGSGVILEAWVGPRAWAKPSMQAAIATRAGLN